MKLLLGDCLQKLTELPDNSVDAIVTDPPYGLSFMGKSWDYDVPAQNIWEECLRVLKPGGHLLAFFGTRTYHRGVIKIEDAGFEIRDQIMWIYGSGFPKSLDVSKAIDKAAGVEREVVGTKRKTQLSTSNTNEGWSRPSHYNEDGTHKTEIKITSPTTDSAKQWQGWGTALKPANEPIVVARKPLEKGLTVAENVLKWGTGALNIDGSIIEFSKNETDKRCGTDFVSKNGDASNNSNDNQVPNNHYVQMYKKGRWPANIIFDEEAAAMLGEPSRFFYVAKASKSERNAGHEYDSNGFNKIQQVQNFHPTVKPIKLMSYLINLVTPPNGIVLDPFMGSGSTGVAAKKLGFDFIGIEKMSEYFEIAEKRIKTTNLLTE